MSATNPLVGTRILSKKLLEDGLIWMVDNERNYCCSSIEVANSSGDAVTVEILTVVADASLSDNADAALLQPAFDDAITLARVTIPDGESRDIPALIRGPALVNFDEIERVSDNETDDQVIARLDKMILQGVRFKRQPATTSTVDLNG